MALSVSPKSLGCQLPVAALDKDDVSIAISVQISDAGIRSSF